MTEMQMMFLDVHDRLPSWTQVTRMLVTLQLKLILIEVMKLRDCILLGKKELVRSLDDAFSSMWQRHGGALMVASAGVWPLLTHSHKPGFTLCRSRTFSK